MSPSADLLPPPCSRADPNTDAESAALVVDDDAAVRATVVRMLRLLGYPALAAADGHEALEAAARYPGPLRLVVTDLEMPGLTGAEVARALGAVRPDTPVLFISGRPAPRDLSEAVVGRPAAFLAKPFTLDALRGVVADLVGPRSCTAGPRRPH